MPILSSFDKVSLQSVIEKIGKANAKWDVDPATGELLEVNVGEKLMLTVSELAEGMEAHRKNLMDDKLPHRNGLEVELADAVIRIFHLADRLKLDVATAMVEKCEYNSTRVDHSHEHRLTDHGKKY